RPRHAPRPGAAPSAAAVFAQRGLAVRLGQHQPGCAGVGGGGVSVLGGHGVAAPCTVFARLDRATQYTPWSMSHRARHRHRDYWIARLKRAKIAVRAAPSRAMTASKEAPSAAERDGDHL